MFSRNKFTPLDSSELELADAIVSIGDVLLIYQIKERNVDRRVDAEKERSWFNGKVRGAATKQVRDTLSYLQKFPEILIRNERGRAFNLAASSFKEIIKIIVYSPSPHLPQDCHNIKSHVSQTAGFIHIIDANDYLEICHALQVPQEIIEYFRFREAILTKYPDSSMLPERALNGHFVVSDSMTPPSAETASVLDNIMPDESQWYLSPILRLMREHLTVVQKNADCYDILVEFIKLRRSAWRQVKERLDLCLRNVQKDEFASPYRMVVPETGCGFIFVPIESQFVHNSGWQTVRRRAIENFMILHKYDQRLSKCVGYLVRKDGNYYDGTWCFISSDWVEDPELQKILDEQSPLRPIGESTAYGYFIKESVMKKSSI